MTERYCPTCAAEVQDAGGFCMLGHRLRPAASVGDFGRAFEVVGAEAGPRSTGPLTPRPTPPPPSGSPAPPPPPPPPPTKDAHTVWDDLGTQALVPNDPIAAFAPPPRMDWGPSRSVVSRLEALLNRPQRPSRASA
jgi:hypothetical protein